MFCSWYMYYHDRPMLLTVVGMNVLLGFVVLRKAELKERLIAVALVTLILLGFYVFYFSSFSVGADDFSAAHFEFPTYAFFAATIGYYELVFELKTRKVF